MSHPPARRATRAPRPSWSDVRRALHLIGRGTVESLFWSERWISSTLLLTRMLERLRRFSITRKVEVDDGWQAGRDVRVAVGPFARLDVRVLIEDHGPGRHLIRFGRRLRPARLSLVAALAAIAGVGVWARGLSGVVPWVGAAASGAMALVLVLAVVWRTARTLAAADHLTADLMTDLDVLPIANDRRRLGTRPPPARVRGLRNRFAEHGGDGS
jgi:hypothetical protein